MDNIIRRALYLYDKPVEYEIKGRLQVVDTFIREHHIYDYPTTVFYQDDNVVFITTGTKPAEVLKRDMNIHFDQIKEYCLFVTKSEACESSKTYSFEQFVIVFKVYVNGIRGGLL